jgi:hypothetical protein
MSQPTLRISVAPTETSIAIILEGRIAGPWAAELARTWTDLAPVLGERKVSIDLSNATYADDAGIYVLRTIYHSTATELVTSSPWTQYLAEEVARTIVVKNEQES